MKFEKINNNQIKVTINSEDLSKNDIDIDSFISNSNEAQALVLSVLNQAEKDLNFSTKDYNLKIETIPINNQIFVLTITRILDDSNYDNTNLRFSKIPAAKRKYPKISSSIVYKFNCFEDFCSFVNILYETKQINYNKISKNAVLYLYKNYYYLIFVNINPNFKQLKKTFSIITEFATYINSSDIFIAKIYESGKPIFKTKALSSCSQYFS